jgi:hypothetical protein
LAFHFKRFHTSSCPVPDLAGEGSGLKPGVTR